MKRQICAMLILLVGLPWQSLATAHQPQTIKDLRTNRKAEPTSKLAPDLEEMLAQDEQPAITLGAVRQNRLGVRKQTAATARTQMQRGRHSGNIVPSAEVAADEKQTFILQMDSAVPEVVMQEKLARLGGKINRKLDQMGLLVIEAPRTAIRQIAADNNIAYVSPNRPVMATGHLETTTGATLVRSLVANSTLDGAGVGLVVIDSGLETSHDSFAASATGPNSSLTNTLPTYSKSFLSDPIPNDSNGHGTHVATMAAGNGILGNSAYRGIASGVSLINLRVLDEQGKGEMSSVIAAIDWCIANKTTYNIRIINLSLGTAAKDSYKNDPLCLAARRAFNAGIVVVAAAGNDGKDSRGQKIYGGIHSPGIDPSVITVGAANTYGTDARSDDTIASYSSRGPTRGYTTISGVRKYDNLLKPDLVAPGNKLIGASSWVMGNKLLADHPSLLVGNTNMRIGMMYLSGTSMSAPVVSGAVALLLQANPNLTPSLVKAILMYSAQPLKNFNTLEQGAGMLNIAGAVSLAKLVKPTLPTTNGTALLTAALPASQSNVIAGQTCYWSKGIITNYGFLSGNDLLTYWQGMYSNGIVLGEGTTYANSVLTRSSTKTYGNLTLFSGAIKNNGIVLGEGTLFVSGIALGDGVVLGDGIALGDGIVLGDGVVLGDTFALTILGDNTTCMSPAS